MNSLVGGEMIYSHNEYAKSQSYLYIDLAYKGSFMINVISLALIEPSKYSHEEPILFFLYTNRN